jgi:hypothetical protein
MNDRLLVPASTPVVVSEDRGNAPSALSDDERARRQRDRDAHVLRWKKIGEAGGAEKWIVAELAAKGLLVDDSPAAKSDKAAYKERKKAEAAEKRALSRLAWLAFKATHITHLGVGVHWSESLDKDRLDLPEREERARANGLPDWKSPDDLAAALGLPISRLRWFAFHREVDTGTHYRRWTIPKRDGSRRTIAEPKRDLKAAQRWTLRNILEKLPVHGAAHGFLASRSIATNAAVHAGADVVVAVDVKDFFPTITWRRVRGLLRKAGLKDNLATLLALVCTEAPRDAVEMGGKLYHVATGPRSLPQGAPTSPAITNAICLRLDRRMAGVARTFGFKYTRYADDLTFSWRKSAEKKKAPISQLLHGVRAILRGEGFTIHPEKTRVLRAGARQKVTGLVVNQAPGSPPARVPRDVVRKLRAAIHNRKAGKPGKAGETIDQLRGMAAFIHMVDPAKGQKFLDEIDALAKK